MEKLLGNWLQALDSMIGDTAAEIDKRRTQNAEAVRVREDLAVFVEFLHSNDVPPVVKRAIERCLEWNPHCRA